MTTNTKKFNLDFKTYPNRTNKIQSDYGFIFSDDIKKWQSSVVRINNHRRSKIK